MGEPYLLLGPEKGKKQTFVKGIISSILKQDGEAPDILRFYPFETEAGEIISAASNGSLFASHTLIIVNQADTIKTKDAKAFAQYLENPNSASTLIFISEESSSAKISAPLSKKIKKPNQKIFWELFDSDKRAWLVNYFRSHNQSISKSGIDYILEMLENNTTEFKKTCQQLSLFFKEGTEISEELLEEFLYHNKEETVFSLFDKIAIGDFQGSLDVLQKIKLSGSVFYPQLVAGLLWQLKKLYSFSALIDQNYSPDESSQKLGIRSKKAKNIYFKATKYYSHNQLKKIIILSTRIDTLLRESRGEVQSVVMELYLYLIIIKKGDFSNIENLLKVS